MAKIVLDPGHGGTAKVGGSSPNNAKGPTGLLEKTVTLDIALRAERLLKAAGHDVTLTRRTDVNLGLAARAGVAKAQKASVFLSIHFNGFNANAQGTETFCDLDHTPASAALCRAVQPVLFKATGLEDRNKGGVKTQGLGVLKRTSHAPGTAACLVEVSFMDLPDEEARLKTDAYREKVAKALSTGIGNYSATAGMTESMLPSHPARYEDGFVALESAQPRRQKARKKDEGTFDRSEFAIIEIGEGLSEAALAAMKVAEAAGFDGAAFQDYVDTLGLRHFSAAELLFLGASNGGGPCAGTNRLPPASLWRNIGATAQMLDEIRERLNAPCRILSCYRAAHYNSCIGGETNSYHMKFNAIDFRCASGTAAEWHAVARQVRSSSPRFKGGIGKYSSFVHIDTRGANADW